MRKRSRKSRVEKTSLGTKPGKVKQVSVPQLFTAFNEMLMNAEVLSDIESIHRVTIDRAVERKLKSSDFN